MITALVQFRLPQPVAREKAQQLFVGSAPKYREASGLIRKYYLLSEDGGTAGGVYLWKRDRFRFVTARAGIAEATTLSNGAFYEITL